MTKKESKKFRRVYDVLFINQSEMTDELKEHTINKSVTNGYIVVCSYMVRKRHIRNFSDTQYMYEGKFGYAYAYPDVAGYTGLFEYQCYLENYEESMGRPRFYEDESELPLFSSFRGFELVES